MKTVPSSRFRTLYAVLDEPTVVTALGRPIGLWLPGPNAGIKQIADEALIEEIAHLKRELAARPLHPLTESWAERESAMGPARRADPSFGSSRPAPKTPWAKKP